MKIIKSCLLTGLLVLLVPQIYGQDCKELDKVWRKNCNDQINSFYGLLNQLGNQAGEFNNKAKTDLIGTAADFIEYSTENSFVNDFDLGGQKEYSPFDYVNNLETFDTNSVSFDATIGQVYGPFESRNKKYFFYVAHVTRSINGYDMEKKLLANKKDIDIYVKYESPGNIVSSGKIYSIVYHYNNKDNLDSLPKYTCSAEIAKLLIPPLNGIGNVFVGAGYLRFAAYNMMQYNVGFTYQFAHARGFYLGLQGSYYMGIGNKTNYQFSNITSSSDTITGYDNYSFAGLKLSGYGIAPVIGFKFKGPVTVDIRLSTTIFSSLLMNARYTDTSYGLNGSVNQYSEISSRNDTSVHFKSNFNQTSFGLYFGLPPLSSFSSNANKYNLVLSIGFNYNLFYTYRLLSPTDNDALSSSLANSVMNDKNNALPEPATGTYQYTKQGTVSAFSINLILGLEMSKDKGK